jgi:pSer/pThr/pTyr-binding forkhead associated (FHA) protein
VPAVKAASPAIVDEVTSIGIPTAGLEPQRARPRGVGGTAAIAQTPAAPAAPAAPPAGVQAYDGGAAAKAPAPSPGGAATTACPQCEHPNPPNNKFCASCGFKLGRAAAGSAPPDAPPAAAAPAQASGVVLTALRADGSEAGTYALPVGVQVIGRDTGAIFAGDSYLSPRHATFVPRGGKLFVRDEGSLNGIYKRLRRDEPVLLEPGDIFRIGQEIIRFEHLTAMAPTADGVERLGSPAKGYIGRVSLIIGRDVAGNAFPVPETGLHLGRERGDVLFPEDGYVSGLHCRLAPQGGQVYLTDLGSSNGSFIRLTGETEVVSGDILLMGQQLFRIGM